MLGRMPAAEISPAEVGTDTGGFRVSGTPQVELRIEGWGYWSPAVVAAFAREAPAASQKFSPAAAFMLDANQLKPQGAEGQEALRALFRGLSALKFSRLTVVAQNALTRMQLTRLARECGLDGHLTFGDSLYTAPAG